MRDAATIMKSTTRIQIEHLHACASRLAAVCDGAVKDDDKGFNGPDARFGRILADTAPDQWSPRMCNIARDILPKYVRQLGEDSVAPIKSIPHFDEGSRMPVLSRERQASVNLPEDNEDLPVDWSEPKNVTIRSTGERKSVRSAASTPEMKTLWNRFKRQLKARGISLKPDAHGDWKYSWWGEPVDDEFARFRTLRATATWIDPKDVIVPETLKSLLKHWQPEQVQKIVTGLGHWGGFIDESDTGTGKTYTALASIKLLGGTPVVVAPIAVLPAWHEAARHFGMEVLTINYESLKTGTSELITKKTRTVTKPDGRIKKTHTFSWNVDHIDNPYLVFDECHRCKNGQSQNAGMLMAAAIANIPVLELSATAAENPLDLYAIGMGCHLFPKSKTGFWDWARRKNIQPGRWGGMEFAGTKEEKENILRDINREILEPLHGARMRIKDIPDFPKNIVQTLEIDFGVNEAKIGAALEEIETLKQEYAEATGHRQDLMKALEDAQDAEKGVEDALRALKDAKLEDKDPGLILTQILRARQEVEILKAPTIADLAADRVVEGHSVVIFCAFQETVDLYSNILDTKCMIVGGQTPSERQGHIDAFQANEEHIILVNIAAGGLGVSLHDLLGRPRSAYIPPDFNARNILQCLGRINRAGALSPAFQFFCLSKNPIEDKTRSALLSKLDSISILNDGEKSEIRIESVCAVPAEDVEAA